MSAVDTNSSHTSCMLRKFEKVCDVLDRYERDPSKLIAILQAIQDEYRYLPEEVLTYVATSLGLPPSRVYGVATFYSHFSLAPKGKYVVRVCDGTACHVKGSMPLLEAVREKLSLPDGTNTTPDMLFTVETVSCIGACGLAPAMLINDDVYGQVTPEKGVSLVEEIMESEQAEEQS